MKQPKRSRPPLKVPEETAVRTGVTEEDGVVLLLWRVETPRFDAASGKTDAAPFYETLSRRCEAFLAGRLSEALREEYRAADPARRRFAFRCAIYAHAVSVTPEGDGFSVARTVTLKRAGRVLFSRVFCERWNARDGKLLPAPAAEEKPRKTREKKREKG